LLLHEHLSALVKVDLNHLSESVFEMEGLLSLGSFVLRRVGHCCLAQRDFAAGLVLAHHEVDVGDFTVLRADLLQLVLGQLSVQFAEEESQIGDLGGLVARVRWLLLEVLDLDLGHEVSRVECERSLGLLLGLIGHVSDGLEGHI